MTICHSSNYRGLEWTDTDRNDRWPDYDYHCYQSLKSGMDSDATTLAGELPVVREMVSQFWAHAQALGRAWYTFPDGLYSCDDEWNQSISTLVNDVCQLLTTAKMQPSDYEPWYKFLKT